MKKNSAFKLKSGNKPSMAKLSGVSPMKIDPIPAAQDKTRVDQANIIATKDKNRRNYKGKSEPPKGPTRDMLQKEDLGLHKMSKKERNRVLDRINDKTLEVRWNRKKGKYEFRNFPLR